jgi:hypothetical protein
MPTKAQEFRTEQQRNAHPPKPKQARRPRRNEPTAAAAQPATDDVLELRGRTRRLHAERRGGAVTEDPIVGKPSRKSTRKSSDGTKRSTNQQLEAVRKTTAPSARAARAQATTPVRSRGSSATRTASKKSKSASRGPGRR